MLRRESHERVCLCLNRKASFLGSPFPLNALSSTSESAHDLEFVFVHSCTIPHSCIWNQTKDRAAGGTPSPLPYILPLCWKTWFLTLPDVCNFLRVTKYKNCAMLFVLKHRHSSACLGKYSIPWKPLSVLTWEDCDDQESTLPMLKGMLNP